MKGSSRFCRVLLVCFVLLLALAVTPVSADENEVKFDVNSWEGLQQVIAWSNDATTDNRSKHFIITITQDIRLDSELKIEGNVTIQSKDTLKTIAIPVSAHAFNVTGSGNLTLLEPPSGLGQKSVLVIIGADGNDKSLVRVGEGGTFTLKGGNLQGSTVEKGGAVFIDGGMFIMEGGVISNSKATYGGGVYMVSGTFIQGGNIRDNNADYGGGVYMEDGKYSLNGGELHENTASKNGGGLYINGGSFTQNRGKIDLNTASGNGGGIFINGGEVEMNNGNIMNNKAKHGGAVYINNSGFWMNGGSLYQNSAETGSAVYMNGHLFTMKGGSIHSNTATGSGGVVYIKGLDEGADEGEDGMFEMLGGSITNNNADYVGGVIVEGNMNVHGSPVIAENTGPDLYLIETTLIILHKIYGTDVSGLTDGARIGIAHSEIDHENPTLFAEGEYGDTSNYISVHYTKYFFSDVEDYKVVHDSRRLYLVYDPPEPEPQGSSVWLQAPSGSYSLYTGALTNGGTVNFPENSPVQRITLPEGVAGDVVVSTEKDPEIPTPSGTVYQQLDISAPALPPGTTATIGISVPASDIPAGQGVSVLHYFGADSGWVREPTTAIRSGDTVRVTATVSGFSPFAIVFEEGGAIPTDDEDIAPPLSGVDVTSTPAETPAPLLSVVAGLIAGLAVMRRR